MINGQIGQWIKEAHEHWNSLQQFYGLLATAAATPFGSKVIEAVFVSLLTSTLTTGAMSYILSARLEERISALYQLRAESNKRMDERVGNIEKDVDEMQRDVRDIARDHAALVGRRNDRAPQGNR